MSLVVDDTDFVVHHFAIGFRREIARSLSNEAQRHERCLTGAEHAEGSAVLQHLMGLADQRWRHFGAAAREQAQRRQARAAALRLIEQFMQERRRAHAGADLLPLDDVDRLGHIPALHEHGARAAAERQLHAIAEARDVRHRRGHQDAVAGLLAPVHVALHSAQALGRCGQIGW